MLLLRRRRSASADSLDESAEDSRLLRCVFLVVVVLRICLLLFSPRGGITWSGRTSSCIRLRIIEISTESTEKLTRQGGRAHIVSRTTSLLLDGVTIVSDLDSRSLSRCGVSRSGV